MKTSTLRQHLGQRPTAHQGEGGIRRKICISEAVGVGPVAALADQTRPDKGTQLLSNRLTEFLSLAAAVWRRPGNTVLLRASAFPAASPA